MCIIGKEEEGMMRLKPTQKNQVLESKFFYEISKPS